MKERNQPIGLLLVYLTALIINLIIFVVIKKTIMSFFLGLGLYILGYILAMMSLVLTIFPFFEKLAPFMLVMPFVFLNGYLFYWERD